MKYLSFSTAVSLGLMRLLLAPGAAASDVGKRLPSECRVLVDRITGVPITALTTSPANDAKIYQTHPQGTFDGQYIIFRSNRTGSQSQAFAVHGPCLVNGRNRFYAAQSSRSEKGNHSPPVFGLLAANS